MKLIIIVLGLILFGLFFLEYVPPIFYYQIGSNISKDTNAFARSIPNSSARILIVGDDMALGVGASVSDHSLAGLLGRAFQNAEIVNLGKSGADLAETTKQLITQKKQEYDLVIILAGGWDVLKFHSTENAIKDLQQLISYAQALSDRIIFLPAGNVGLAPIFPFGFNSLYQNRASEFHLMYANFARESDIRFVDIYNENEPKSDQKLYYSRDQFHLSDQGYSDIFDRLLKNIESMGIEGLQ